MVIVPPGVFLDAAKGQPRWMVQAAVDDSKVQLMAKILDPGDSGRAPLMIANGSGVTVCRVAMATTPDGSVAPPRGNPLIPGSHRNDSRRARPLPWTTRMVGAAGAERVSCERVSCARECVCAAVDSVGRDPAAGVQDVGAHGVAGGCCGAAGGVSGGFAVAECWGRPAALDREPRVSYRDGGGDSGCLFLGGARGESGAAAVEVGCWCSWGVGSGHNCGCGGGWVWVDRRSMAVNMEHYGWEGWERVGLVGAYVAALLWGVGRIALGAYRLVRRRRL